MSEASEIFDMIRRAIAFSEPDRGCVFETFTVENETGYRIWSGAQKYPVTWSSDDEFLNGNYGVRSIWAVARSIVEFFIFKDSISGWRPFLLKYPGIVDIFRAVSESSSPEELRLRLTASGLL